MIRELDFRNNTAGEIFAIALCAVGGAALFFLGCIGLYSSITRAASVSVWWVISIAAGMLLAVMSNYIYSDPEWFCDMCGRARPLNITDNCIICLFLKPITIFRKS